MRKSTLAFAVLALALIVSLPTESLGCMYCASSPNGWGFCRSGAKRGYDGCSGKVVDSWTGRTWCDLGNSCYNGGTVGDGGGGDLDEPLSYADGSSPCSWTDTETIRLV